MYKNNTGNNREMEMKRTDAKQHEFSEKSQCLRLVAVAIGGYTQIVVNPMQLEDEAFMVWMQRLTEARRNRENKVQRPNRNYLKPYNDKHNPSKESGKDRYGKYQINW